MGHHKDIHKSIYRVSVPVAEVTCVSKLLLSAVGGEDEEDEEDEECTNTNEVFEHQVEKEPDSHINTSRKRRRRSKF